MKILIQFYVSIRPPNSLSIVTIDERIWAIFIISIFYVSEAYKPKNFQGQLKHLSESKYDVTILVMTRGPRGPNVNITRSYFVQREALFRPRHGP